MRKSGIFFIVEPGRLEYQAEILVKSLRKNGEVNDISHLHAIQPRRSGKLSKRTLGLFEKYDVLYEKRNLNRKTFFYPVANKILAGAYFEEKYASQYDHLLFLDTDILILSDIKKLLKGDKIQISPSVGSKNMAIKNKALPKSYWNLMFSAFKLKLEDFWYTRSLSDGQEIYHYYSTGVVSYPTTTKLFSELKKMYEEVFCQREILNVPHAMLFFTDQMLLACYLAKKKLKSSLEELSIFWNYPICLTNRELEKAFIIHHQDYFEEHEPNFLGPDVQEIVIEAIMSKESAPWWLRMAEIVSYQHFKISLYNHHE